MKTIIHLLSGGLDSVTMLYDLQKQGHSVHCLMFDYRQRHRQELQFGINHARRAGVLWTTMELPALGGMNEQSWIVPNRNAVFLSCAVNVAAGAGADTVTIGCNSDDADYFPDCRPEFLAAMNTATRLAGYDVEICAPYLKKTKQEIGRLARELGVTADGVWTCYLGGERPCGTCPACLKLRIAMP